MFCSENLSGRCARNATAKNSRVESPRRSRCSIKWFPPIKTGAAVFGGVQIFSHPHQYFRAAPVRPASPRNGAHISVERIMQSDPCLPLDHNPHGSAGSTALSPEAAHALSRTRVRSVTSTSATSHVSYAKIRYTYLGVCRPSQLTALHLNSAPLLRAGLAPRLVTVTDPGTVGLVAR
jgi:hypothetical protein